MIPGVSWNPHNRRWRAVLSGAGNRGYIGEYLTEGEAIEARRAAELRVHGHYHDIADIEIDGDVARVPIWAREGLVIAWALIDTSDIGLVEGSRWAMTLSGYAVARRDGRVVYLHRLLVPGEGVADHVSGEKMDCRRRNLRRCSQADNSRNARVPKNSPLGLKGVRRTDSGRFSARIMFARRGIHLGTFGSPESAGRAYDRAAAQYFGEFARLNFPEAFAPQGGEGA